MKNFASYVLFLLGPFIGCSVIETDWPSAPEGVYWKRQNYTFRMTEQAAIECGYPVKVGRNNVTRETYLEATSAYEECMLNKGFVFSKTGWPDIDPGYLYKKSNRCVLKEHQLMPACQSLIKKDK